MLEEELQKLLYHITWVTHNSRVSDRMKKYFKNKGLQPLVLNIEQEIEITSCISRIVKEDNLKKLHIIFAQITFILYYLVMNPIEIILSGS
ncbi:MAG TPA: hypothetical protein VG961_06865 [Ignavibacteria bacterium]|nr:hypothetical protein [Ignavibacteria bacterium]